MILCDTLEKKNAHIISYFDRHGIEYENRRLNVGDYMIDGGTVSIDRKSGLQELATNLLNRDDKSRFWREIRRAKVNGIHLVVLIESNVYKSIPDVVTWRSKYSQVTGRALMDAMYRAHISYGVDFMFAPKVSMARRIIEILTQNENI